MNIETIIKDWIEATNTFNTKMYLDYYATDAVLDDRSVGKEFRGKDEIEDYFEKYFKGYETKTKIIELLILDEDHAHLQVEFTGNFPEKIIGGRFDFTFINKKIIYLKADLI